VPAARLIILAAAAAAFLRAERTPLLDYHYAWPAEAGAIPALRANLQRQERAAHADAIDAARDSRNSASEAGVPFHREQYREDWRVAGSNARYLSLTADIATDNNGAHPNSDHDALLWSKAARRAVTVASVLGQARVAALTGRYCARLDAMRRERTGEAPTMACPPLAGRKTALADRDRNGRFEALRVLIPPYVASSYADGSFIVDVPLIRADLAGLAAADRPYFESARR
jgi:hypothetical protein